MAQEPVHKKQKTGDNPASAACPGSSQLGPLTAENLAEYQAAISELQAILKEHLEAHHGQKNEESSKPEKLAHRIKMPYCLDIKAPQLRATDGSEKVDEQDIVDVVKMVQDHMWELHQKIRQDERAKRIAKAGGMVWFNETEGSWKSFAFPCEG